MERHAGLAESCRAKDVLLTGARPLRETGLPADYHGEYRMKGTQQAALRPPRKAETIGAQEG